MIEIEFPQVSQPGAIVFLAWLNGLPWEPNDPVDSIEKLSRKCSRWLDANQEDLRAKAIKALEDEKFELFEILAIDYLARHEFSVGDYFTSPSRDLKIKWVAVSFAYQHFNEFLPNLTPEQPRRGAPKLPANINVRRYQFIMNIQSIFMHWAYQIFQKIDNNKYPSFPFRIDLSNSKTKPVFVLFENIDQLNELYKLLRRGKVIPVFRDIQEYWGQNAFIPSSSEMKPIWQCLNNEIGLGTFDEWTTLSTIGKSFSLGKSEGEAQDYNNNSFDVRMNWEIDQAFLSNKSLF